VCENLCEKNFPKSAKIRKNQKKAGKSYLTNSVVYNNLRRLENSEVFDFESVGRRLVRPPKAGKPQAHSNLF
jgi:hypothetical protein